MKPRASRRRRDQSESEGNDHSVPSVATPLQLYAQHKHVNYEFMQRHRLSLRSPQSIEKAAGVSSDASVAHSYAPSSAHVPIAQWSPISLPVRQDHEFTFDQDDEPWRSVHDAQQTFEYKDQDFRAQSPFHEAGPRCTSILQGRVEDEGGDIFFDANTDSKEWYYEEESVSSRRSSKQPSHQSSQEAIAAPKGFVSPWQLEYSASPHDAIKAGIDQVCLLSKFEESGSRDTPIVDTNKTELEVMESSESKRVIARYGQRKTPTPTKSPNQVAPQETPLPVSTPKMEELESPNSRRVDVAYNQTKTPPRVDADLPPQETYPNTLRARDNEEDPQVALPPMPLPSFTINESREETHSPVAEIGAVDSMPSPIPTELPLPSSPAEDTRMSKDDGHRQLPGGTPPHTSPPKSQPSKVTSKDVDVLGMVHSVAARMAKRNNRKKDSSATMSKSGGNRFSTQSLSEKLTELGIPRPGSEDAGVESAQMIIDSVHARTRGGSESISEQQDCITQGGPDSLRDENISTMHISNQALSEKLEGIGILSPFSSGTSHEQDLPGKEADPEMIPIEPNIEGKVEERHFIESTIGETTEQQVSETGSPATEPNDRTMSSALIAEHPQQFASKPDEGQATAETIASPSKLDCDQQLVGGSVTRLDDTDDAHGSVNDTTVEALSVDLATNVKPDRSTAQEIPAIDTAIVADMQPDTIGTASSFISSISQVDVDESMGNKFTFAHDTMGNGLDKDAKVIAEILRSPDSQFGSVSRDDAGAKEGNVSPTGIDRKSVANGPPASMLPTPQGTVHLEHEESSEPAYGESSLVSDDKAVDTVTQVAFEPIISEEVAEANIQRNFTLLSASPSRTKSENESTQSQAVSPRLEPLAHSMTSPKHSDSNEPPGWVPRHHPSQDNLQFAGKGHETNVPVGEDDPGMHAGRLVAQSESRDQEAAIVDHPTGGDIPDSCPRNRSTSSENDPLAVDDGVGSKEPNAPVTMSSLGEISPAREPKNQRGIDPLAHIAGNIGDTEGQFVSPPREFRESAARVANALDDPPELLDVPAVSRLSSGTAGIPDFIIAAISTQPSDLTTGVEGGSPLKDSLLSTPRRDRPPRIAPSSASPSIPFFRTTERAKNRRSFDQPSTPHRIASSYSPSHSSTGPPFSPAMSPARSGAHARHRSSPMRGSGHSSGTPLKQLISPTKLHHRTPTARSSPYRFGSTEKTVRSPGWVHLCSKPFNSNLHPSMGPCDRCWSMASETERQKFKATGSSLSIVRTKSGCNSCESFPIQEGQDVRLCRTCFFATHARDEAQVYRNRTRLLESPV